MKRSETTEQINLFNWAKRTESILQELALLYHVPNEGKRTNGGILKAAGLKSGVPDICLPVAMGGFHGLYIELKFGKNKTTKSQDDYIGLLKAQGYKTAVCYGAEEAREEILDYLTEPGRMPKKVCVTAPWIAGKCDGIGLPSKMFAREECRGCKYFNPGKEESTMNKIMAAVPKEQAELLKQIIINLSCKNGLPGKSMEETLESVNKDLAALVKARYLTVQQSAEVLTIAMKAYEVGKKERNNARVQKNKSAAVEEEQREMPDGLQEQTGYCRFCGQAGIVRTMVGWSEDRINEQVTIQGQCENAQAYAKAIERKEKAKKRINELFGEGAEKPVKGNVVEILLLTVDAIEDKAMKGITVDVGHGIKAKVSKMAKESIKVERSENKKTTYEE